MDREQEYIRSGNWSELRRFYSESLGSHWEEAWARYHEGQVDGQLLELLRKSLRDPHFEQASYICLRFFGEKLSDSGILGPTGLRLFDAYQSGELRPLSYFLLQKPAHYRFAACLLKNVARSKIPISDKVIENLCQVQEWSPLAKLRIGEILERRLQQPLRAESMYLDYFSDAWSQQASRDFEDRLLDANLRKKISFAYSQKDGLSLKRFLRALAAKATKLTDDKFGFRFRESSLRAIEYELNHITENLSGFAFWNHSPLSPQALKLLKDGLFEREMEPVPKFVSSWESFFSQKVLRHIPLDVDPESLALWQIAVEVDRDKLPEALLKFPNQERFLFLWSLRSKGTAEPDSRRWPAQQKEADVVRANLERAFRQSSNKLLWFSRLRKAGCSQNFYEFTMDEIDLPLSWILEDLEAGIIEPSQKIRSYVRKNF